MYLSRRRMIDLLLRYRPLDHASHSTQSTPNAFLFIRCTALEAEVSPSNGGFARKKRTNSPSVIMPPVLRWKNYLFPTKLLLETNCKPLIFLRVQRFFFVFKEPRGGKINLILPVKQFCLYGRILSFRWVSAIPHARMWGNKSESTTCESESGEWDQKNAPTRKVDGNLWRKLI